jgi:hypothetical protein
MNRIQTVALALLLSCAGGLVPAQVDAQPRARDRYEDKRDRKEDKRDRKEARKDAREDRRIAERAYKQGYYDASRDYRQDDRRYRPRRLGRNDVVYRGSDNRYYCKRDDGTTGLILGGIAGGALGNIIAPGGSKTLGTIIGAGAGAIVGKKVDDGDIVCR